MRRAVGIVRELQTETGGLTQALISCPAGLIPAPGQYLLAHAVKDGYAPLAAALFPSGYVSGGFQASSPVPIAWQPGMELSLYGPLGRGFCLPPTAHRLALAALGSTPLRLLPLLSQVQEIGAEAAFFTELSLPELPSFVEVSPLFDLPTALSWTDFLVVDVPFDALSELPGALGLPPGQLLPCDGQVLVTIPMPCGGVADCGACAVHTRHGWRLACKDGPVFPIGEILG